MSRENGNNPLDRQLTELAGQLRERGMKPSRDLWPDIDRALGDQAPVVRQSRPMALWRVAALAATLALAVGLGYVGMSSQQAGNGERATLPEQMDLAQAAVPGEAATLENLDSTLQQLNDALSRDPGNPNLSRLVLLVHRSRASVLRQNTTALVQ